MPVIDVNLIEGPNVQASGEHRGQVEVIFDDRTVIRPVKAQDALAWAQVLVDVGDIVEQEVQEQDADEGIGPDVEITANKQANIKQRAVAYLRRAWQEQNAEDAFLMFDKFNDYRLAQGLNLNQVAAHLLSAGLTQEEWDAMKTAYQYLSAGQRPAVMASARVIQENWINR